MVTALLLRLSHKSAYCVPAAAGVLVNGIISLFGVINGKEVDNGQFNDSFTPYGWRNKCCKNYATGLIKIR